MKQFSKFNICLAMVLIIGMVTMVGLASAKDLMLESEISSISIQPDKNGNDYGRIFIEETRELNGVDYKASVAVMCFGSTVEAARNYSKGDSFKAVVSTNEYRGRLNYSVIQFVK